MKLKQIRVDGYKNLVNATLELGDFNVLVGPNNSGKSNLLEAIQMLGAICFGDDKLRKAIFEGMTPPPRDGSSVCHLEKHKNKPMTIGVAFEITMDSKVWSVDYEVKIQCGAEKNENVGFISEALTAKEPSKTGKATTYINREGKKLAVWGKKPKTISRDNSSLLAINSLYPDFEKLPPEMMIFVEAINSMITMDIFALSPKGLRNALYRDKPIERIHVSSFDLPFVVDKIKEKGKYYKLFRQSLCDILALEDVEFHAENFPTHSKGKKGAETSKRVRSLSIKQKGAEYSLIDEYSDGTLAVAAILAMLLSKGRTEPIICIEEPENYLHPAALEKLLRFLQDHADKWPVLITTHSPYLLNCVKNVEDVAVAVVDETGATHFKKIENTKQLRHYLKRGFMSFGDMLASNFQDVMGK